jgi:alpha-ketoglutarate-dependent taurine dioxygenase
MSHALDKLYPQPSSLIRISELEAGTEIPLMVRPEVENLDLVNWARENLELIETLLFQHGALLFRGFTLTSLSSFREFAEATSEGLMSYSEPSTTRTELTERIYTTTEYPATEKIALHSEMSYSNVWPMKIWFHCVRPADAGGETPIGDTRKVFNLLDPKITDNFNRKKIMYVRNYGAGLGLSWETVFNTTDKSSVENYCRENHVEYEWIDETRLRTRHVRQAIAKHPRTGQSVWFNQAHIHNILNFPAEFREALLSMVESKEFPLDINCVYGDGSPIEASVLEEIRDVYAQSTISFPWLSGDVLMLDNMLISHGRNPFSGPRKVVVTMGEPYRAEP